MNHPDFLREVARTGGPAYPSTVQLSNGGEATSFCLGMTLRDYFAAAALQGKLAAGDTGFKEIAQFAYLYADAMLKARDA